MRHLTRKYMFGLLDYETWILQEDGRNFAVVTTNSVDRTVKLGVIDGQDWPSFLPMPHTSRGVLRLLEQLPVVQ